MTVVENVLVTHLCTMHKSHTNKNHFLLRNSASMEMSLRLVIFKSFNTYPSNGGLFLQFPLSDWRIQTSYSNDPRAVITSRENRYIVARAPVCVWGGGEGPIAIVSPLNSISIKRYFFRAWLLLLLVSISVAIVLSFVKLQFLICEIRVFSGQFITKLRMLNFLY